MNSYTPRLRKIVLKEISGRTIDSKTGQDFSLISNTQIEILDYKPDSFKILVKKDLAFEPEGVFVLEVVVIAYYSNKELALEVIKEMQETLLKPALNYITLIVAFISEKFINGSPIIIPPFLDKIELD